MMRWSRKLNLTRLQLIVIPIHHPGHWTLVVVRIRERLIVSYDSFTSRTPTVLRPHVHQHIADRIQAWVMQLKTEHTVEWEGAWTVRHEWRSLQLNGWDCGLHVMSNTLRALNPAWRPTDFHNMTRVRCWMYRAIRAARGTTQGALANVTEEDEASQQETCPVMCPQDDEEVVIVEADSGTGGTASGPAALATDTASTCKTPDSVRSASTRPKARFSAGRAGGKENRIDLTRDEVSAQPTDASTEAGVTRRGKARLGSAVSEAKGKRQMGLWPQLQKPGTAVQTSRDPATTTQTTLQQCTRAAPQEISTEQLFARQRLMRDEDDEYAVEQLPGGTYYPITKLLRRNVKGTSFKVRWKGFQRAADEWRSRAALMKDCPDLVRAFEEACKFDPMAPPVETAGWREAREAKQAITDGIRPSRNAAEVRTHRDDVILTDASEMSWDTLRRHGLCVDPEDEHRTPPNFHLICEDFWRTPPPKADVTKQPRRHDSEAVEGQRSRQAPDRLGMGSVCADNHDLFLECEWSCAVNAPIARRITIAHMLKYHDGRQWGLHAMQEHQQGDFVGPYVGEVVNGQEGARRKQSKIATTPSYLLQLGNRFIDAEGYGNAMRFINHTCVAPNCRFEYTWVQGRLHIQVVALRDIQRGEEYTTAYGFEQTTGSACHCGQEHCQHFMGNEVQRHPVTKNGYRPNQ